MPMYDMPAMPQMPQQRPYVPYAGQPVPGMPGMPPGTMPPMQPPPLPDPSVVAGPLMGPPLTANATGGPTAQQGALREGVFSQLYRLGRQAAGPENLFDRYGPKTTPPIDPLAALMPQPEAPPTPVQLPQLPPAPPPYVPSQASQQQPGRVPLDHFRRAQALMARMRGGVQGY